MRSLQRRMYGDKRTKIPAKGITTPELGGLFGENAKPDSYKANGTIYVFVVTRKLKAFNKTVA